MITRKAIFRALAAIAICGSLAAAAATAAPTLPVKTELNAGAILLNQPPGRPWSLGLLLGAAFSKPDGSPVSPVRTMKIRFPHATVNDSHFKTCTTSVLLVKGPNDCPGGSKIGSGTAVADARPLVPFLVPADLTVFNGPKVGKARHLSILVITRKLGVTLVLDAVLRRTKGRYGFSLNVPIPRLPTVNGSNDAGIASFNVKIKAFRHGFSYIEAPTNCPAGGLPFDGVFGFADGTTTHAASAISCTLRGTPKR